MRGRTAKRLRRGVGLKLTERWIYRREPAPDTPEQAMAAIKEEERLTKLRWKRLSKPKSLPLLPKSGICDRFALRRIQRYVKQIGDLEKPQENTHVPWASSTS